ncbi:thioredoxin family protein [Longimicrobium sp.]|uniref:thioredoxin family protein n=1 Tax=Longimicrobium sp. TaxID=2029185 RepID=UPI002C855A49|nr:thioredoxin family protein [Longimicrobium sp.]HSU14723.1 thioredoxin family protein [Longimicrobium sp.]
MTHRTLRALRTLAAAAALTLAGAAHARAQQAQRPLYDPRADAHAEIRAALASAARDRKLVLLDFGADWCLDCVILERLFQDAAVQPYLRGHFHVVKVDVGQFDHNLEIVRKYGSPIEGGVPAVVVLAPSGAILANTRDGSMEGARRMTAADVRRRLEQWVAAGPRS